MFNYLLPEYYQNQTYLLFFSVCSLPYQSFLSGLRLSRFLHFYIRRWLLWHVSKIHSVILLIASLTVLYVIILTLL